MDLLDVVNAIYLVAFVALVLIIFVRLFLRLALYLLNRQAIPLLLKRDFLLFAVVFGNYGLIFTFRFLGISNLQGNPYWVIPSGGSILVALVVWAYIEIVKIDGN